MWKAILERALIEDRADRPELDVSTLASGVQGPATFQLLSKGEGVFCGRGLLDVLSDWQLTVTTDLFDGRHLESGRAVARVQGDAATILRLERSVLNLLSYTTAIATRTDAVVRRVAGRAQELGIRPPRILATRKTHPGLRDLALYAVSVGGGDVHRRDLSSSRLIKDNHLRLLGGIARVQPDPMDNAMLEVSSIEELRAAGPLPLRGVLLDNMSSPTLKESIAWIKTHRPQWLIEVSGKITFDNVTEYVLPGVDRLSLGELTHTVKAFDFSLKAL